MDHLTAEPTSPVRRHGSYQMATGDHVVLHQPQGVRFNLIPQEKGQEAYAVEYTKDENRKTDLSNQSSQHAAVGGGGVSIVVTEHGNSDLSEFENDKQMFSRELSKQKEKRDDPNNLPQEHKTNIYIQGYKQTSV